MCFDSKTSFLTFSISAVCFSYLLFRGLKTNNRNDLFLSVTTILIGLMQLIEFFLWRNQTCNDMNHYFSLFIIVILFLQGTITNILYLKLYPTKTPFFSNNFVMFTIILYSILVIYILNYLNKYQLCSKPTANSCRLVWNSFVKLNNNNFLFASFLFFYFFMFCIMITNSLLSNDLFTKYPLRYSFLIITFILAGIYVVLTSNFFEELSRFKNLKDFFSKLLFLTSNDVFGSVWCFLCVFIGIIGILKI